MRRYPLYFFFIFILFGCSASTPTINEYTLFSSQISQPKSPPISSKTLSVALSKSIGSLLGKNIIYLYENGQTGPYLYSRWSDTPAALIQRSLLASLNEKALFASLSPATSLAQTDWVLESNLDAFYHRFYDDKSEGYIDITYRLVDTRTKQLMASKRFTVSSPAASMDAKGGVEALKIATGELNRQCIDWLTKLLKEKK